MAKISALPPADPLTGAETLPVLQNGATRRATLAQMVEASAGPFVEASESAAIRSESARDVTISVASDPDGLERPEFSSVAALLADTLIADSVPGRTWRTGGFSYLEAASGATDHHLATAGGVKLYVLPQNGAYHLDAFGCVGDGATSDASDAQKAFDICSIQLGLTSIPSGTNSRPWHKLVCARKQYHFATPVTLPSHVNVEMNGATFSAPAGGRIFNGVAESYRHLWQGPGVFWGDDVEAVHIDGDNLNNALFKFTDVDLSTQTRTLGKWGISISSRSSRVIFENCNQRLCQFGVYTDSDFTHFDKGWWSGHVGANSKPGGQGSVRFDGNDAYISGVVGIPEGDGRTRESEARWIDKHCKTLRIAETHFGTENGGVPIVYEFYSATYDAVTRTLDSSIKFDGCQIANGGSGRPDAGAIVLQNGVLPGVYTFDDCEGIGLGRLVSAHGYAAGDTEAAQNAALRTALQAASATYRGGLQIRIDQHELTMSTGSAQIVPNCMRGYIVGPRQPRTATVFLPASATALPVAEIVLPNSTTTGQRAWTTFDLKVTLHRGTALGPMLYQEKVFRVTALHSGTSAMDVRIHNVSFFEEGRITDNEVGDVIINLGVDGTPTSTYGRLAVTLDDLDPVEQYQSMQVSIIAEGGTATGAALIRRFISLYPGA